MTHALTLESLFEALGLAVSGPHPFQLWGLVSWKTVFPQTGVEDNFGVIQAHCLLCPLRLI